MANGGKRAPPTLGAAELQPLDSEEEVRMKEEEDKPCHMVAEGLQSWRSPRSARRSGMRAGELAHGLGRGVYWGSLTTLE